LEIWTPSPSAGDVLSGEIFDDPPPRSWPDGAFIEPNVSELEQRGAAMGKITVMAMIDDLTGETCLARRRRIRYIPSPWPTFYFL
jgi:hypothetical protein